MAEAATPARPTGGPQPAGPAAASAGPAVAGPVAGLRSLLRATGHVARLAARRVRRRR